MDRIIESFLNSWATRKGVNSTESILNWIAERNSKLKVEISRNSLEECEPWYYDVYKGAIVNRSGSFFSICGIQQYEKGNLITEQPIIIQNEIGFLGIICCEIDGVLHFLMQAKIEPGNINKIQISPTIQATKSNFTQKHGGSIPVFLDYFINATPKQKVVDQIQSEQSSRFLKKRNRNVILMIDEPINEPPTHRWMSLGQIKGIMRHDNLVNMDTRTVLSCIPYALMPEGEYDGINYKDKTMLASLSGVADRRVLTNIFHVFNDYKMFGEAETKLIDLYALNNWSMKDNMFISNIPQPFRVIFCNISIEGREVKTWKQPLFEAMGKGTFGLFCCKDDGVKKFLVKATPEIGCFDSIELGPSVQREAVHTESENQVTALFFNKLASGNGVLNDVMLSEEGGRFFHEENRNVIIEINQSELSELAPGYFWSDYKTLNTLAQVNNCLNIQLRNLLSLLEV